MRFPIIRALPAVAISLLISAPAQAQLSKEATRFPRIADIADLTFEPSGPFAGDASATSLPEGRNLQYELLDAEGKATAAPAGAVAQLGSAAKAKLDATLMQVRKDLAPTLVTVPAGTFSCYPVASQYVQSTTPQPGLKVKSSGRQVDYYDPAVGLIKTDYYDSHGQLLQSRVLSKLR
ncbi:hypothetical protein GCM10028824_05440 [Hymenobacter segetis]|uniref:DUF3108 domain-containing protein n=1 Tax=Hymenobacter segetis TaxID=2025509 RepID=A0ABU9LVX2_9BACT